MSNPEGPNDRKLKAVPKGPVIQFIPSKDDKGLKGLKKIQEDLEKGLLDSVIILYQKDGETFYHPLTDASYETFGWMLMKTALVMMAEEDDGVDEE